MKKAIVIASAVIAILFALYKTLEYGYGIIYLFNNGPIGARSFFTTLYCIGITTFLLSIPVSLLVILNIKPNKLLGLLLSVISTLNTIFFIVMFGILLAVDIKDFGSEIFSSIIDHIGYISLIITSITYIRRALKPAQK